jgi:hypothetical protein
MPKPILPQDPMPTEDAAKYAPKPRRHILDSTDEHEVVAKGVELYNQLRIDLAAAKIELEAAHGEITRRDTKIEFLELQVAQLQNDANAHRSDRDEAVKSEAAWRAFFANVQAYINSQDEQMLSFFHGLKALFERYHLPNETPPKPEAPQKKRARSKTTEAETEPQASERDEPVPADADLETPLTEIVASVAAAANRNSAK